jgi:hypothetical protein
MIPIREVLRHETRCYGQLNDRSFDMTGGGRGRPFDGVVRTELTARTALHFPPPVLAPVLIMGYPTFSTYHPGAFDLFKISDGYSYKRSFSFENGGKMETTHEVKYFGDHLTGDFRVDFGDVELPDLMSCEPTVETFIPSGPGVIRSQFLMAWHLRNGGLFHATVRSEYKLSHNAGLPYMQFRYITFDGSYEPTRIEQIERLNVFRDLRKLWFPPTQADPP